MHRHRFCYARADGIEQCSSGLLVASGDGNIVEWNTLLNLSYHVKRAASSGGPYTTIASTAATGYIDTTVTNGIRIIMW